MVAGPRRRTLVELSDICRDEALFAELADGRAILTASRKDLEAALGISRGGLWRRTRTLVECGLASDDGRLILDVAAIRERIQPRVVSLPSQRTREYRDLIEANFETTIAADGTPMFHHNDGRPATLSDIAEVTGASSRGTAHHHLRRLQTVPSPNHKDEPTSCEDLTAVAQNAIESLAALASTATVHGRVELVVTAIATIDTITRCIHSLTVEPDTDVAVSARSKPRHYAALREPKRDANAAAAPLVSLQNEYENDSSHPHDALAREANRDITATSNRSTEDKIPAAERQFTNVLPDWNPSDWDSLVAPLSTAWAKATGNELRIDRFCIDVCQAWPKSYVRRALNLIATEVTAGRRIKNPGGLLAAAARDGKTHYFPLRPPETAADPELARTLFLGGCRDGALKRLAAGADAFTLANTVLTLATVRNTADPAALAVMVEAVRREIIDSELRLGFEEQLLSLAGTQLAWISCAFSSIDDITAAAGDRRKAH